MTLYKTIFILISVFFFSCKDENYYSPDKIKYVSTIRKYDNLNGEILPVSILGVYHISTIDSLLIFITKNPNGFVSIVNINDNTLICNICCKGRGPNEYLLPYSFKQYKVNDDGDKLLYLTDDLIKVNKLNITQSIKENVAICEKIIDINITHQIPFFLQQEGLFIKQKVSYDDPRDQIYYSPKYILKRDTKERKYDVYPDIVISTNYPHLPLFIYESIINIKPDLTKVIDVMACMDNMNIINLETGKSVGIKENNTLFLNDFKHLSHEELVQIVKYCAIDVTVTDNYIMILHDGRTVYNVENKKEKFKPTLKIFNWDGDFIQGYQLSEPLRGIAYNENNQCLYGFDMEDNIYRYNLTLK